MILGQINTSLPDAAPAAAQVKPPDTQKDPNDQPLQLVVSITKPAIVVWSITKLEGSIDQPKARIARLADGPTGAPVFDYRQLNAALYEIASRRWRGKLRARDTYEIILMADGEIAYETVVAAMDAMRKKLPEKPGADAATFAGMPKEENRGTAEAPKLEPTEVFDPDKHYLFPDIMFSKGLE
jgi:biopolymer transport protein ExbD